MDLLMLKQLFKRKQIPAGILIIGVNIVLAVFAPVIATYPVDDMDFSYMFAKPGEGGHLLGTDDYGRDIFSRMVYGSRISLMVGVIAVGIGAF